MRSQRTRDDVVQYIIGRKGGFTFAHLRKTFPTVPQGTLGGLLTHLKQGGALALQRGKNGAAGRWRRTTRMPKSVEGARTVLARIQRDHMVKVRRPPAPVTPVDPARLTHAEDAALIVKFHTWEMKAVILDRLVADLGLTPVDLLPYTKDLQLAVLPSYGDLHR